MGAAASLANPLRAGLVRQRKLDPAIMVLFGGTGDLSRRKLMPSLYELHVNGRLPDRFEIVAFSQSKNTREKYQRYVRNALDEFLPGGVDAAQWERFADRLYYISSDFGDEAGYRELGQLLDKLSTEHGTQGNVLFYLASPASFFPEIVEMIGKTGLSRSHDGGWKRIVIEKPFGRDLQSARALNDVLDGVFSEGDIFRVDHYLGKETVQNIITFRFANSIFEPIWNRRYIDHVQITVAENIGVGRRGAFYEETGAVRDMVQNHCLQMLCLVAMEPPYAFEADAVRDEKAKVLRAVRKLDHAEVARDTVRGQYGHGVVDGVDVPGYREEPNVSPDSNTETYVAARLFVDNWRWQDVPFYIRTGKMLSRKKTEIAVQFKPVPHGIFGSPSPSPNMLVLRIEPDEGIALRIETKQPGPIMAPRSVDLDFRYLSSFGILPAEAYHRLLIDCVLGEQMLFGRRDAVEAQWEIVMPILNGWAVIPPPEFPNYEAGTWGPAAADRMLERDGRRWRRI